MFPTSRRCKILDIVQQFLRKLRPRNHPTFQIPNFVGNTQPQPNNLMLKSLLASQDLQRKRSFKAELKKVERKRHKNIFKATKEVTMLLSLIQSPTRQLLYIHSENPTQEKAYFYEDWLCSNRQVFKFHKTNNSNLKCWFLFRIGFINKVKKAYWKVIEIFDALLN